MSEPGLFQLHEDTREGILSDPFLNSPTQNQRILCLATDAKTLLLRTQAGEWQEFPGRRSGTVSDYIVALGAVTELPANPTPGDVYLYSTLGSLYSINRVALWTGAEWEISIPKHGALAALSSDFGSLPGEWLWQYVDGFWDSYVKFNRIQPNTIYGGDGEQLVSSGRDVYATSLSASDLAGAGERLLGTNGSGSIMESTIEGVTPIYGWVSAMPSSPTVGDRFFILQGAASPWDTRPGQIAKWFGSFWEYTTPPAGALLRDRTGRLAQVGNPGVVGGLLTNGPLSSSDLAGSGDRPLFANSVGNAIQKTAAEALSLLGAIPASSKGDAYGVAPLDAQGRVPAGNLPSYVDDVLEFADFASFPGTGEGGKIYIALATNRTYRWGGSAYVEVSPGAIGGSGTTGLPAVWGSGSTLTSQSAGTFRSTIGAMAKTNPDVTGRMMLDFGWLRESMLGGNSGAIYPPVAPSTTNHTLLWDNTGSFSYLNATLRVFLTIGGVTKVEVQDTFVNFGTTLRTGGQNRINVDGDGTFKSLSATGRITGKEVVVGVESRNLDFNIQDTTNEFIRIPTLESCTVQLPAPGAYGGFKRKITFGANSSFSVAPPAGGSFVFKRSHDPLWTERTTTWNEGTGVVTPGSVANVAMDIWCDGALWYVVML